MLTNSQPQNMHSNTPKSPYPSHPKFDPHPGSTNLFVYGFPPTGGGKATPIVKILTAHHIQTTTGLKIVNIREIRFIKGKVWDEKRCEFDTGKGANIVVEGILSQSHINEINGIKKTEDIYHLKYYLSDKKLNDHQKISIVSGSYGKKLSETSNKKSSNNKNALMESHKYIPPPLRSKILPNTTKLPLTNDKTLYNPSSDQERPHLNSTNRETYSNNIDDEDTDNNIECDPLSQEIPNNHNINDATENNNKKRDALTSKTLHSNPTRTETHVIITHSNVTQTTPLSPHTAESPFQASPTPNKKLSCSTSTSFPNANTISLDGNNNADKNININQTININASKIHRYLQFKTNTKFDETNTQHSNLIHTKTHLNNSHLTNTETRGDKIIHSNLIHRDPHSNTPHMTATVPNSNNQIIQNNYAIMRALPHCILTLTQNLYLLNGKNENILILLIIYLKLIYTNSHCV